MRKKDEIADPTSCLNRASDDEPVFVLRANDSLAAEIVIKWCHAYRKKHCSPSGQWNSERRRLKHNEALDLAELMDRWAEQHPDAGTAAKPRV